MYDPTNGRMLSVDNFVQDPYSTQGYNRYSYALNNPLKYTDPDGEHPILVAMAIGAMINLIVQDLSGNINSAGDALLAFGIGAAAGAAGYGLGLAAAGSVGVIGFGGGAITGAAGGFAGGFVGGAGNAWMNGASFVQGMNAGMFAGGIGALLGGMIGGLTGGITSVRHGGDFWSGEGALFESYALPGDSPKVGKDLEYSNKFVKKFTDDSFGKIKGLTELHADGIFPLEYSVNGNVVTNNETGAQILGVTRYLGTGNGSDVYMAMAAFSSKEKLYLTLGHEFLHVGYNISIDQFSVGDRQHRAIYKWQLDQAKLWKFNVGTYKFNYNQFKGFTPYNLTNNPNYFPPINIRPWQ